MKSLVVEEGHVPQFPIAGNATVDLHENFTRAVSLNKEVAIKFRELSGSALTDVCASRVLLLYRRALCIILSISVSCTYLQLQNESIVEIISNCLFWDHKIQVWCHSL